MLAQGFAADMLAHLVLIGCATAQPEINKAGGRRTEVVRMADNRHWAGIL
jgi:hypothetical protein